MNTVFFLEKFLYDYHIQSVVDFGCGDWQFSRYIPWETIGYTGYDVVESLLSKNNSRFSAPNIRFLLSPTNYKDLKEADLFLAKDVLQHLPNQLVAEIMEIALKKYRYLLITNCTKPYQSLNTDIQLGEWRPLDLRFPPFNMNASLAHTFKLPAELGDYRKNILLFQGKA